METIQSLISRILALEEIDEDIFRGFTILTPIVPRVYGGQVIGQALHAASKTLPETHSVHSLHSYFVLPGDPKIPILYLVSRTRDGKSFSNRIVRAVQNGKTIFYLAASFQKKDDGQSTFEFQSSTLPDLPLHAQNPEDVPSEQDIMKKLSEDTRLPQKIRLWLKNKRLGLPIPIDMRPINPIDPVDPQKAPAVSLTWMRANGDIESNPHIHRCIAAYMSDWNLISTMLRPHAIALGVPTTASLDHSMYFHHPFRADEWLLYSVRGTINSGGRGLAFGEFFDRAGTLVVSTVQEGMLRMRFQQNIESQALRDEQKLKEQTKANL
eukprot:TRINITY_DN3820_c0_g1_i1.p1 TRINITY_DN3820_c0_g1~~TRINITY_DN3820_c0_g1_i1.p1  ORF type:complete len:324 (-),score=37.52 TRINITY_DN3820_c0_g1_i1:26-997(-)